MHDSHALSPSLQTGIGLFYFLVMLMNVGFALYFYYERKNQTQTIVWSVVAGIFGLQAVVYLAHFGWSIPPWLQHAINAAMDPRIYFILACIGFALLLIF